MSQSAGPDHEPHSDCDDLTLRVNLLPYDRGEIWTTIQRFETQYGERLCDDHALALLGHIWMNM